MNMKPLFYLGILLSLSLNACNILPKKQTDVDKKNLSLTSSEMKSGEVQNERKSIFLTDGELQVSESLKGAGYSIPEATATTVWMQHDGQKSDHYAALTKFKIIWERKVGKGSSSDEIITASPVTDGNAIYTMDVKSVVTSFDINKNKSWDYNLKPLNKKDNQGFGGGLALTDSYLIVTSGFRYVSVLDKETGKLKWSKQLPSQIRSSPVVNGKYIVFTDIDNQVFCLDIETSQIIWTYQAIIESARILKSASPIIKDNKVLLAFSSGELTLLNLADGSVLWERNLTASKIGTAISQIRDVSAQPVIYNNIIYASAHSGGLSAIDFSTGELKWNIKANSVVSPFVSGDVVYSITLSGKLICASKLSGQIYWISDLDKLSQDGKGLLSNVPMTKKKRNTQWNSVFLTNNQLVAVSITGEMFVFNPIDGNFIAKHSLGKDVSTSPIIIEDVVYFISNNASLFGVR